MSRTALRPLPLLALLSFALGACGDSTSPESTSVRDLDGALHEPLRCPPGTKASVILFITTDCPIANKYCPEIARIHTDYKSRGVTLLAAHVDPDTTPESAREHAADYALPCPVVIDTKHALAKRVGATRTPEAVVIVGDGEIVYRGRIDDRFQALGDRKNQVGSHDLRDALDAVLAGRAVPVARTETVGCLIPAWE